MKKYLLKIMFIMAVVCVNNVQGDQKQREWVDLNRLLRGDSYFQARSKIYEGLPLSDQDIRAMRNQFGLPETATVQEILSAELTDLTDLLNQNSKPNITQVIDNHYITTSIKNLQNYYLKQLVSQKEVGSKLRLAIRKLFRR